MNALNPLRFTSHQKTIEKCLPFNLANFWMIKLTKTSILPNCKVPNFFWYTYHSATHHSALGKKTLLSAWDRSRDSTAKRDLSKDMYRTIEWGHAICKRCCCSVRRCRFTRPKANVTNHGRRLLRLWLPPKRISATDDKFSGLFIHQKSFYDFIV